jgi:hypothetical protein
MFVTEETGLSHGGQEAERERERGICWGPNVCPNGPLPPTRPHFLKVPRPPHMPLADKQTFSTSPLKDISDSNHNIKRKLGRGIFFSFKKEDTLVHATNGRTSEISVRKDK